jgi:hypothetical protein
LIDAEAALVTEPPASSKTPTFPPATVPELMTVPAAPANKMPAETPVIEADAVLVTDPPDMRGRRYRQSRR